MCVAAPLLELHLGLKNDSIAKLQPLANTKPSALILQQKEVVSQVSDRVDFES
jgi:hypothetical protein